MITDTKDCGLSHTVPAFHNVLFENIDIGELARDNFNPYKLSCRRCMHLNEQLLICCLQLHYVLVVVTSLSTRMKLAHLQCQLFLVRSDGAIVRNINAYCAMAEAVKHQS